MTTASVSASRRSGGRKARRELRLAVTNSKAVKPGLISGRYRPLTDHDMERIHQTALDVLEKIGVAGGTDAARELMLSKGCWEADNGRICFPRALIEAVITNACHSFVMYGRDPRHDIELAGQRMHFGISGAAVTVLEYKSRDYRPATITDLYDFARLVDQLEHIHRYGRLLYATDLKDEYEHDVSMVYANMAGTQKHFMLPLNHVDHLAPVNAMLDMVLGGEGRFRKRPFGTVVSCPIVSPLTFGHKQTDISMAVARAGTPITIAPAPQSGATAPAALAGALVQAVAEGLAIIALLNFVNPGHPACMVLLPFVSDLRSGAFTGGGEEAVLMAAAA